MNEQTGKIRIIGLCGKAGAGKTTAARALEHYGFRNLRFAAPLKEMCRPILSARELDGDLKEAPLAKLCGKSPRQFMQLLGGEFTREMIGRDLWVNLWRESVEITLACTRAEPEASPCLIVVDNVRYPNEAAAVHDFGGIIIRIDREGAGSATGAAHASEAMAFEPDLVIRNQGSEEAFGEAVADAIADYTWR